MSLRKLRVRLDSDDRGSLQRWTLDGETFEFKTRYNGRDDRWYLDIRNAGGAPIVAGIGLVCGSDLLRHLHHLPVPKGSLFMYDSTKTYKDAGLEDVDTDVVLLYRDAGTEVEEDVLERVISVT